MLRIADQWHGSDLGLQRQGNEDNYFVRAPLFVVADGMGGAQSGEVASEMAVEAFGAGIPDGDSPAEGLVHIIETANQRIHERSRSETQRAGMGTTVTAAYVGENSVTVAHVGDSRCYRVRDGELQRLTDDHSLVGDLVRLGKLTEEQAETHPQRSVITRALGPEPNVMVDVEEYGARAGDLFLVCSDGLTSMVREDKLKPLLSGYSGPLDKLGHSLIAAANQAGGRDNITVILFTLAEIDAPASGGATAASALVDEDTREYNTFTGEAVAEPRQGVSRPQGHTRRWDEVPAGSTRASDEAEAEYRASGTVALSAVRPRAQPIEEGHAHAPPREQPRRRRRLLSPGKLLTVACIIGFLAAFWLATRQVFFVGVDESRGNVVTLYKGLPYDLPLGIRLYSPVRHSGVTLQSLPPARRATFTNHKLRPKDDAESLVKAAEDGTLSQ
ncbi:Stp1/IreP family PP2C-type Ser/Thr phosphatase [Solirubrobacter soli]|uniref:Stp1/IreP family PP2C-type Ser/Thr phosphatase n=1 Tax=Solirubrobacter soli TaxID=363832 RepID=UPI00042271A6|nr:Stp1/IreP family PP2C-type Ser/Thr phosphatase [Solirubrobacter soli]